MKASHTSHRLRPLLASAVAVAALVLTSAGGYAQTDQSQQQTGVAQQPAQTPRQSPADSSQTQQASGANAQQGASAQQPAPLLRSRESQRLFVTPARLILGRDLTEKDGSRAGTIKFLMIDVADGEVIYALAAPAGVIGKYVAVPWRAIDAKDWIGWRTPGLSLSTSTKTLREARRFDIDQIIDLTSPAVARQAAGDFGVKVVTPRAGAPVLLLGRDTVGTLARPTTRVANQLEGSTVVSRDGERIGQIDEVMVDVDKGRTPYVLVSVGGFLGSGQQWLPVPPQALIWDGRQAEYRLDATSVELRQIPLIGDQLLEVFIRKPDLDKLYDFFNVDRY